MLLAEEILNEPGICFYPARFKPPHIGHWEAVTEIANRNYITKVIVIISQKPVDGITADDSKLIWDIFKKCIPNPKIEIQVSTSESPIKDIYSYLGKHPLDKVVYIAYNDSEEDDPGYVESIQKAFGDKVQKIAVTDKTDEVSSPKVRDMLSAGDYDGYVKSVPQAVIEKGYADEIFKIVASKAKEPEPEELNESGMPQPLSYLDKLDEFVEYCMGVLEMTQKPEIEYIQDDNFTQQQYSFGGYMPGNNSIMVVVTKRNLMDIGRSLAHELVHAKQNENGGLTAEQGATGSDIENEANAKAGIIMRNWGKLNPDWYLQFVEGIPASVKESLLENLSVINDERGEIVRTAEEEGIDEIELTNAFKNGKIIKLNDAIWSQIENTDSYDVESREEAINFAKEYGKDWEPIDQAVKTDQELPLPMVLKHKDRLTLVGGNTRLMFYRAYNKYPEVLLATISENNEIK